MKLIQLQAFKEVMNAGTATEASRRLRCSQPRVSRLISELEEHIGFPLFRREKQRLEPTAEGILFYKESERILLGIGDIERIAEDIYNKRDTCLRVLCQSHLAHGLLNHAIGAFEKRKKDLRYYLEIRPREELAKWLGGHQFDLAFAPLPAKNPLVRHEQLISVRLLAALLKDHPLAAKEQISIEELNSGPLIALTRGMLMRRRLDSLLQKANLVPNIRIETPTVLSACQLTLQGMGTTLTDPFMANVFTGTDLVFRPLVPEYTVSYGALYLRQDPPRKLVRQFIEVTREVARKISMKHDALPWGEIL